MSTPRPKPPDTEEVVDKALLLLRSKMKELGFTQRDVQRQLVWGNTYISQLFRKQKGLRLDQLLAILAVIGVSPGDFFRELFPRNVRSGGFGGQISAENSVFELLAPLTGESTDTVLVAATELLITKGYLAVDELVSSVRSLRMG